ncbi:metallophosphoesterase family protein [Psychrobacillus soli]|uniref:Phosphoesterase n=1 Tax=Psychrobacillus soli TaxID=1543965 RepID=A0A544TFG2_9BACI|nr:metallophosphoesterase [Psychrobacillus soli]TQR16158.1 metallophosphoesterase [Psychrobacillus soli]
MKILVMSDTHRDIETMERVMEHCTDVNAVIHCGDSELAASYFDSKSVHIVRGNCDFDEGFSEEVILELENETILIVHGHKHQVKTTLMPLKYRAEEVDATIVCFGHSHLLGAELQNGTLYINPGSLHKPRGRKEKSYAIIEKLENAWNVLFFSSKHVIIEKIIFKIY